MIETMLEEDYEHLSVSLELFRNQVSARHSGIELKFRVMDNINTVQAWDMMVHILSNKVLYHEHISFFRHEPRTLAGHSSPDDSHASLYVKKDTSYSLKDYQIHIKGSDINYEITFRANIDLRNDEKNVIRESVKRLFKLLSFYTEVDSFFPPFLTLENERELLTRTLAYEISKPEYIPPTSKTSSGKTYLNQQFLFN